MKTASVILSLLLVFQGVLCDTKQDISDALNKCVTESNQNKEQIIAKMNEAVLPEDDDGFTTFFTCFSKTLGAINDNKDADYDRLIAIVAEMLKLKLGSVPDVEAKASHIATIAVNQCKNTPRESTVGLTAIKSRNCIKAIIKESQPH